jgi:integrase
MASIFMDRKRLTLADVSACIKADEGLTSARRGAVRSAISTLSRVMGMPPTMVPADPNFIRRKLSDASPAAASVKAKRFSTVKSQVMFALRHMRLVGKPTYLTPMVGEWAILWERLPDKYARTALSRFFRYCSARGLDPRRVSDSVAQEFHVALTEECFIKDPRVTHQNLCRVWNSMIGVVAGWPDVRLTVPRYARHYIRAADTFPASFWQDVDAWIARQGHDDILDLNAPPRALRPRTLRQYRYEVRRFASMLVLRGHDPEAITSLAYLVQPKHVVDGLRFLLERNGNKPMRSAADVATLLGKIAKHWVKSRSEDISLISRYARSVMPRGEGLGRKNRLRLAPLRDPKNIARLFLLPGKIRKDIEAKARTLRDDALLMQWAVALLILTYAPLRIGTLSILHIERNLRWSGPKMTGMLVLDIDGNPDVKNGLTLSFPLPEECADLIRLYLRKYHPRLTSEPNPYLFPSDLAGRPKRSDTLGKQLSRLIRRSIGLEVNPHLYRHLVHIIVLNRYPGAYAMVSRVLGHKSLQTAISNYAGEDMAISLRAFQGLVTDVLATGQIVRHNGAEAAYHPNDRHY